MNSQASRLGFRSSHLRMIVVVAALGAMLGIGVDLASRDLGPPGRRMAEAIRAGYGRTPPLDADAAEDERLSGSDNEAGYRWAERRSLDRSDGCPETSPAFRQGCEAYVKEQNHAKPNVR